MDLNSADAASGPDTGNAGASADKDPLSAAINSALEASPEPESKPSAQPDGPEDGSQQTEQAPTDGESQPQPEADKASPPEGQAEAVEAPQHWPADRREAFAKLPEDARKLTMGFVKDLQGGFTRKMQEVGDKVRFADAIGSLFNDGHIQRMQRDGVDAVGALRNLVQLDDYAARDPVGYLKWAMQTLQVDPSKLMPQQQPAQDPQQQSLDDLLIDPNVKSLQQRLEHFERMIADGQRQQAEQHRQQIAQHASSLQSAINQFRSSIADDGQLKYPHFDAVQTAMGALMDSHPKLKAMPDSADKLDLAYRMAVQADPDLGKTVIESEVSKRLAAEKKALEAQRAKQVGGIRPATGAATVRPRPLTLDDAISGAMAQAGV